MKGIETHIARKRAREQELVKEMIVLYCRKKHGEALCTSCRELLMYARKRSDQCPFMENKTFCSSCKVHCYKPGMREKMKQVMRFSGPRMLLYHPCMALWHMSCTWKEKSGDKKL